jgi:ABC-2 type transport system ATP-binding protein
MITLDQVSRYYGNRVAVDQLSLEVSSGEIFAFLGPNGAGKTTTIKMIVGLLRPSQGNVRLCGFDVTSEPDEAKRRLGYVPDVPYLYEKLSGREFLEFVAEMFGFRGAAIQNCIAQQIDEFRLHEFIDDLAESYSHGMRQRVALAAGLLHQPSVLVIDEPMIGLDPRTVRLVKDLLRAKAKAGMAIFMSTHLLSMAEEIADRVGIVDRGQLRFLGTMAELQKQSGDSQLSLEQLYLNLTSAEPVAR